MIIICYTQTIIGDSWVGGYMKKVIVELRDFSKSYGDKTVIENINLSVYEGEFLTLLGSSGCGKTTILRSISGLDKPTKGKVFIDGEDVTELEPPQRQVNTIFQNYALFPLMTIEDNVAFGLKMKNVPKDEMKDRVSKMLELVHLEGYEKRKPKELSGGEQQRVSIIRGLINNPKVLLLDEPLSALDLKLRKKMHVELKQLQKKLGITFIYVTHDQDEALSMSDRIVLLKDGKIEQIGSPVDIYEKPNSLYAADFIGEINKFTGEIVSETPEKFKVKINDDLELSILETKKYKIGDKIHVVVRPENIKISTTERKTNCLKGVISEQIYDGSFTKVMIKVNKQTYKSIISGNDKLYKKGDEVYIYWTIEDAIILGCDADEEK